jgi:hypothetical protein
MKSSKKPQQFTFQSKLECIAEGMKYFALAVPAKVTSALKTHGPVPVTASVNGSKPFLNSLYPVGEGRHYLRIKAVVWKEVNIKEGDRVRVEITVRDRTAEVSIPKDLASALRAEGVSEYFEALPLGKKSYLLRLIDEAAKPQTREKRIQDAVEAAHEKREKQIK